VTAPGERVSTIVTSGACVESIRARTEWPFEVGAERAEVRS
jgi:hypothetical protein